MAGSEEPTRLEKCDGCRDWGCVWVPGELGAIPQEMALEDVQHHGFTPGHEQRGAAGRGDLPGGPGGAASPSPEHCVPLGDVVPPFALSALLYQPKASRSP